MAHNEGERVDSKQGPEAIPRLSDLVRSEGGRLGGEKEATSSLNKNGGGSRCALLGEEDKVAEEAGPVTHVEDKVELGQLENILGEQGALGGGVKGELGSKIYGLELDLIWLSGKSLSQLPEHVRSIGRHVGHMLTDEPDNGGAGSWLSDRREEACHLKNDILERRLIGRGRSGHLLEELLEDDHTLSHHMLHQVRRGKSDEEEKKDKPGGVMRGAELGEQGTAQYARGVEGRHDPAT